MYICPCILPTGQVCIRHHTSIVFRKTISKERLVNEKIVREHLYIMLIQLPTLVQHQYHFLSFHDYHLVTSRNKMTSIHINCKDYIKIWSGESLETVGEKQDLSKDERSFLLNGHLAHYSWLVGWLVFLWHINFCRLFNAKCIFIQIISSISNNSV